MNARQKRNHGRARRAGLYYVNAFDRGITRRRRGSGFSYYDADGERIASARTRARIEQLAIPPAWREVWICGRPNGHIQASGVDDQGRKQYIYHSRWQQVSTDDKFGRMRTLATLLPRIRRRVRRDLRGRALSKPRVLAAVVRILDKGHIRVGNRAYADDNGSRGATTLNSEHVDVEGLAIRLDFPGKGGKRREVALNDRLAARVIRQCEELDEQFLFCYRNGDTLQAVTSTDVNQYLTDVAGETITAKDFRTWWGSVITVGELCKARAGEGASEAARRRTLKAAIAVAAEALGNTETVCRASYVHPGICAAALSGRFDGMVDRARRAHGDESIRELTRNETLFAHLLPALSRQHDA